MFKLRKIQFKLHKRTETVNAAALPTYVHIYLQYIPSYSLLIFQMLLSKTTGTGTKKKSINQTFQRGKINLKNKSTFGLQQLGPSIDLTSKAFFFYQQNLIKKVLNLTENLLMIRFHLNMCESNHSPLNSSTTAGINSFHSHRVILDKKTLTIPILLTK